MIPKIHPKQQRPEGLVDRAELADKALYEAASWAARMRETALNVQRAIQSRACPLKQQQAYLEAEWMAASFNAFRAQIKRYPFDKDALAAWGRLTRIEPFFGGAFEGYSHRNEYVRAKMALFEHGSSEDSGGHPLQLQRHNRPSCAQSPGSQARAIALPMRVAGLPAEKAAHAKAALDAYIKKYGPNA